MCNTGKIVITVDIKKNRIRIYKSTMRSMGSPKYVQLLVCPQKQTFAIRGVEKEDHQQQTIKIMNNFLMPDIPCEIYSHTFIVKLKKELGKVIDWSKVDKEDYLAWKPYAKLTNAIDEVVKSGGTKYSVCPVFKPLRDIKEGVE